MKARRHESWGVHLGWEMRCMGGVLVKTPGGVTEWHYDHIDIRTWLETGTFRNYGDPL